MITPDNTPTPLAVDKPTVRNWLDYCRAVQLGWYKFFIIPRDSVHELVITPRNVDAVEADLRAMLEKMPA